MASSNRSTATNRTGTRYTPRDIVGGYAELVRERMEDGFEPTFLSFMFNPLRGSRAAVVYQMRDEVERVYAWMLTHRCRRPNKTPNHRMPLLIACPDWPVPKYQKSSLRDVTVNNGLHLHGFDLTPPETRLVCALSDFIADHQAQMAGPDRPLARVYAETFKSSPEEVVGYVLKSLPRGRADSDDLIILPRASNEIHHRAQF